ncbi:hypothetical protein KJ870_03285 [bacterium]|nr:hypothetical protein [bacterium]MBU1433944.1 hypothetical protein [bacterium]MBU1502926.1 hypothetical protein [bacterium]
MIHRYILFLILGVDALLLFLQTSEVSISYEEALLLYGEGSFLQLLIKISLYFFGQNDYALRLPMIILHTLSAYLLYKISDKYLADERSKIWLVLIFILLPGVISSAILVNSAGLVIFGLLLFVYIHQNYSRNLLYPLLVVYLFIESDFVYLFLSLVFFAFTVRDKKLFLVSLLLFTLSTYLYGLDISGSPSGYFLDIIGIYSAVFTPIVFIYIFYVLYRRYFTKEIDLLWFIASVTLLLSILLSFRQRVDIEHFAPYVILALPLAAKTFVSSYKVRLKIFRKNYRNIFTLSLIFLLLNSLVVFFNKELYNFIENPQTHFAYKMHVAKELADELKNRNINCIHTNNIMAQRLRFYGVNNCDSYILVENKVTDKSRLNSVTISYKNKLIYEGHVTKVNK